MHDMQRVALLIPSRITHLEGAIRGVVEYARAMGGWSFEMRPEQFGVSLQGLVGWPGDGAIALIDTESDVRLARELSVPVVNLSGVLRDSVVPRVMVDHAAIGRLAAEHLLQCGFRTFAYYGLEGYWYSELRARSFIDRVRQEGHPCDLLLTQGSMMAVQSGLPVMTELNQWLTSLEGPVGLMACNDQHAMMVIDICHDLGREVPHDVAVIGVDNEKILCDFCVPPLTSVSRSDQAVGHAAAQLLDQLMAGATSPTKDVLIPSDGVVKRKSTDVVITKDPRVAEVVRYIHAHFAKPLSIKQITSNLSFSRRSIEQQFRVCLDCTPYQFLCRIRIEQAKKMFTKDPSLKVLTVAKACGFSSPLHFRRIFSRLTGMTPRSFRRKAK